MKISKKATRSKLDEVDRALDGVHSAIGRLVGLLLADDPNVVFKAALALCGIGEIAALPLATAISRAEAPRHRLAMLTILKVIYKTTNAEVGDILLRVAQEDPDDRVGHLAADVLTTPVERELVARIRESAREAEATGGTSTSG